MTNEFSFSWYYYIVYDDKKANLLATTHYSLLITRNTNTQVYNHGIEKMYLINNHK